MDIFQAYFAFLEEFYAFIGSCALYRDKNFKKGRNNNEQKSKFIRK